jgi:hypothetical protein
MTEEVKTPRTIEQIKAEMQTALASGDMKALGNLSKEFTNVQKAGEKAELDAKQAALKEKWSAVYDDLFSNDADNPGMLRAMVDEGELDVADGVWIAWDFGAKEEKGLNPSLKFFKKAQKAAGEASGTTHVGTGKKFASTAELLKEHGSELATGMKDKEGNDIAAGRTWQEVYDASKGDGNAVYRVRMALAKALGIA